MSKFNTTQLRILLCFYLFDNKTSSNYNFNKFVNLFSNTFKTDFTIQDLIYQLVIFKNLDSRFSSQPIKQDDERYLSLWKMYVENDRISELKTIYKSFKSGTYKYNDSHLLSSDININDIIQKGFTDNTIVNNLFLDCPKDLYENKQTSTTNNMRDANVVLNALKYADYSCEYSKNHESFLRKNSDFKYTEGHHLVPLKFQNDFNVNLDVEANVVSLCSNCHNNLHYGRDYEKILTKLYNERKERLKKCGIYISLEQLINMYR